MTTKTGKPIDKPLESDLYAVNAMPPIRLLSLDALVATDDMDRKYYDPNKIPFCETWLKEQQKRRQQQQAHATWIVRAAQRRPRGLDQERDRWPEIGKCSVWMEEEKTKKRNVQIVQVGQDVRSVTSRKTNFVRLNFIDT